MSVWTEELLKYERLGQDEEHAEEQERAAEDGVAVKQTKNATGGGQPA